MGTSNGRENQGELDHSPVPLSTIKKVLPSICKIKVNQINGTGFFMKINDIIYLFSNEHVIKENLIDNYINIELSNGNKIEIELKSEYVTFFKELDITMIDTRYLED